MQPPLVWEQSFTASAGRLTIICQYMRVGRDLLVLLTGGESHLGACAFGEGAAALRAEEQTLVQPGNRSPAPVSVCEFAGHRDSLPACEMAQTLADKLGVNVIVNAGIHFDGITADEIASALALCRKLGQMIIEKETGDNRHAKPGRH